MLKAAVIGTGKIATQHLSCLKGLRGVEIAGVCDRSPATAEATADRFGVKAWYTDHRRMLAETKPDLVHVTTPPESHFALALEALNAGCHVLVEKPITVAFADFQELRRKAENSGLWLLEDHNYLFNTPVRQVRELAASGEFGEVVHVEAMYCLNMKGGAQADPNAPVMLPGGGIYHFLSHLAYLACVFIGAHRSLKTVWRKQDPTIAAPYDEFRALIDGERGTAMIGFSGNSQPDGVWLTVHGSKMRARANLFEGRLTIDRLRAVPRPLLPLANAWTEARDVRRAAWRSLKGKLRSEPGVYEGLWELLRSTYAALEAKGSPPITLDQIDTVNRLVAALLPEART
jgi:predicted dehydrogenase